jgi:hypothetical protein
MRPISINNETRTTTKISKSLRTKIAEICKSTIPSSEKVAKVKAMLQNTKDIAAIVTIGQKLNIHTSGKFSSTYTYSL